MALIAAKYHEVDPRPLHRAAACIMKLQVGALHVWDGDLGQALGCGALQSVEFCSMWNLAVV